MDHSVACVHCGTPVLLETRIDPTGTRLLAHLLARHPDRVLFDGLPRWDQLLEHFRVVPPLSP
jgi:hypothetical protein